MFTNITIKNFRCFESLEFPSLAPVNLIAGKNNTGKTAVLEAIRLLCDPTDSLLPTKINEQRSVDESSKICEELWGWLFRDKNPENEIEMSFADTENISRRVTYRLLDANAVRTEYPDKEQIVPGLVQQGWYPSPMRLIVKYEGPPKERTIGIMGGLGQAWYTPVPPWSVPSFLVSSGLSHGNTDVDFFSKLETEKRQSELLPGLQILEPRLQRLSIAVVGGRTIIHGETSGVSHLVPLYLMGEGMRRLLTILLAIANSKNGVLLIDEIENGFHHSVRKQVWQAIGLSARQAGVQVFATTHSYECIQSADAAFSECEPYDLRLFRLDRIKDKISLAKYDREMIDTALDMYMEVR